MFWALCDEVGSWTGWRSWLWQSRTPPHHWQLSGSSEVSHSPGTRGTFARIFQSQILKILSLMRLRGSCWPVLTSVFIPAVNRVNYGWYYGCFLHDMLDTLTIVISWVKILEIVTRHFAIVPKEKFIMKSMTERTISWFLSLLDEPSRLNAQQNWFFSIWFFHLPLENVQFAFEGGEERGLLELFFHFPFTRWPFCVKSLGNISYAIFRSIEIG